MREFDKWIPDVRVAPCLSFVAHPTLPTQRVLSFRHLLADNGEKESRAVIEEYELFHGDEAGGRIKGLKVCVSRILPSLCRTGADP